MLEKGPANFSINNHEGLEDKKSSWGVALALLLLLVVVKLPTLMLPYHWDEMGAYVTPAKNLADSGLRNIFIGFSPGPRFFGHPPLLYTSLALTYKVFGFSVAVSHGYVLFWSFLSIFYTYRLGKVLFNKIGGVLASLFLLFTPLYFSQSGLVLGEMPITALGVMAVYYAVRTRILPCVFCSIAAVLMKETAVAIPIAIAIYAIVFQKKCYGSTPKLLLFGLPVVTLACFYCWQKSVTGQWVANPYFSSHSMGSLDINNVLSKGVWVASFTCLHQYRALWMLLILLHVLIQGKKAWKIEYVLFGLIGLFIIGAFSVIYFGQRYILAALPYLAIVSAGAITSILQTRSCQIIIGAFIIVMSMSVRHEHECGYGNFDYDMQYTDIIAVNQQCCRYLEQKYPDVRIAAFWPIRYHLSQPWQGYVTRPLTVVKPSEDHDFVIYHKLPLNVTLPEGFVLRKRFEKNNKTLELYCHADFLPIDPEKQ